MKEYSQIQKFISVLMIFILLIYLSGCISSKIISISKADLPLPDSGKYAYIVHSGKWKFLLEKSTISNGILSSRIIQTYSDKSYDAGNKIHLYLSSDSVIKFDTGEFLSVPLDEVTKAELQEIHGLGASLIIPIVCFGVVMTVLVIYGFFKGILYITNIPA
jgi:hypothetical protein